MKLCEESPFALYLIFSDNRSLSMHSGIFVLNGDSPQDFSEHFFHSRLLIFPHFSEKEHNVMCEIERNSNKKGKERKKKVPGNRQW